MILFLLQKRRETNERYCFGAGFLALMLLGLYLMVKLAKTMQEMREHKETDCFYIATSNPCVVKRIMEILNDMKALHSDKHYTLSIRQGR